MRGRGRSSMGIGGILAVLLFVWLIIGAVAAGQRHYYDSAPTNCASTGTIAATIVAGPLNYMGINPKIADCQVNVPQPSP
ncbi:hypothetical protein GFY24_25200 [Nocardia sp. SYP-A9097]|uniref:hypothetical protein n=1 Tax=Nocardia sp. SYP-A9097 TaxID=2663237 RepID=UPI00129A5910|nr:hypothetical protein [Nocardia sp. SYP-A9097]MRH90698.1 hypothetical protein [Nocardia sp. SYP-A9097]